MKANKYNVGSCPYLEDERFKLIEVKKVKTKTYEDGRLDALKAIKNIIENTKTDENDKLSQLYALTKELEGKK